MQRLRTSYVDKRTGETVPLDPPAVSKVWQVGPTPELNAQPGGVLLAELPSAAGLTARPHLFG